METRRIRPRLLSASERRGNNLNGFQDSPESHNLAKMYPNFQILSTNPQTVKSRTGVNFRPKISQRAAHQWLKNITNLNATETKRSILTDSTGGTGEDTSKVLKYY